MEDTLALLHSLEVEMLELLGKYFVICLTVQETEVNNNYIEMKNNDSIICYYTNLQFRSCL